MSDLRVSNAQAPVYGVVRAPMHDNNPAGFVVLSSGGVKTDLRNTLIYCHLVPESAVEEGKPVPPARLEPVWKADLGAHLCSSLDVARDGVVAASVGDGCILFTIAAPEGKVATMRPLTRFRTDFPADSSNGEQNRAVFCRRRRLMATGGSDGTVRIWKLPGSAGEPLAEGSPPECVAVLRGHTKAITDLCWDRSGFVVASTSEDGTCRVWDLDRGTCEELGSRGAATVGDRVPVSKRKSRKPNKAAEEQAKAFKAFACRFSADSSSLYVLESSLFNWGVLSKWTVRPVEGKAGSTAPSLPTSVFSTIATPSSDPALDRRHTALRFEDGALVFPKPGAGGGGAAARDSEDASGLAEGAEESFVVPSSMRSATTFSSTPTPSMRSPGELDGAPSSSLSSSADGAPAPTERWQCERSAIVCEEGAMGLEVGGKDTSVVVVGDKAGGLLFIDGTSLAVERRVPELHNIHCSILALTAAGKYAVTGAADHKCVVVPLNPEVPRSLWLVAAIPVLVLLLLLATLVVLGGFRDEPVVPERAPMAWPADAFPAPSTDPAVTEDL